MAFEVETADGNTVAVEETTIAEFLANFPPGKMAMVKGALDRHPWDYLCHALPDIVLHCSSKDCGGERTLAPWMDTQRDGRNKKGDNVTAILSYICRNCMAYTKHFALAYDPTGVNDHDQAVPAVKIGEWPPFGPPTPARVISLVGPDKANFLKGRRCEFQGLGIGAFAYYRRIIETQKNRLLDEIIRVAKRTGADPSIITSLEAAKKEIQFKKAIGDIRPAVPPSLMIGTENPLLLLHTALSDGLHDQSDEHCLDLAKYIRDVLFDLAERIGVALKDDTNLQVAVAKLAAIRSKK